MSLIKKRSKQVVDRKVQGALAWRVIFHFCAFILMGGFLGMAMQLLSDPFQSFGDHCQNFWRNSGPQLAVLVLLLPVFVYDTIKLSNRIAGPVARLRSTMNLIRRGEDTAELSFRKADYWQEMAGEFNDMVHELKRHERILIERANSTKESNETIPV